MTSDEAYTEKTPEDIQKSIEILEAKVEKIQRRLMWMSLYGIFKLVIIIVPLIIGLYYFSPQIKSLYQVWSKLSTDVTAFQRGEYISPNEGMQEILNQYIKP